MVWAMASTTLVALLVPLTDPLPVLVVLVVLTVLVVLAVFVVDGCCLCDLYRLLAVSFECRGVVISLFGIGGSRGLSGASVDGDIGGGDLLPLRR